MKAFWKGAVAFGLVTFPVKLYKATEERTLKFHQLHAPCDARIRLKRVCSACNEEVSSDAIVRGYEYDKDRHVVLTDTELDRGVSGPRVISIQRFITADAVDPIYFLDSYYLGPDEVGASAYRLLTYAMRAQDRVALATLALRDKERPVILRLFGDVIVLQTMLWPDEIRSSALDHLDSGTELRPQELEMARSLVENLAGDFDPGELRDTYRERVEALVAAKIEGKEPRVEPVNTTAKVVDLMEALTASVEATSQLRARAEV